MNLYETENMNYTSNKAEINQLELQNHPHPTY